MISSKNKFCLATLLYILFIFAFTTVGRSVSELLIEKNLQDRVILFCFIFAFILFVLYFISHFNAPDRVAVLSLGLTTGIFFTLLMKLPLAIERIHFLEFGILALLLRKSFSWRFSFKTQYCVAIFLTALIGLLDEFLQFYLPKRVFDLRDISLNAFSGLLTIVGYEIIRNRLSLFRMKKRVTA